jgi:Flp pilus assembly protein TadG
MTGNRRASNQQGATAIEAALLLPMLIVLIFGMIEFGLLMYNRQILTNASREGARAGIVVRETRLTDGEIASVVDAYCQDRLVTFGTSTGLSTTVTRTGTSFGDDLTVQASYDYDFLVLSNLGFGPVQLEAQTVMKYE